MKTAMFLLYLIYFPTLFGLTYIIGNRSEVIHRSVRMSGHFLAGRDMSNEERKKLSRNLTEKFREFITQHSPSVFSRHLRNVLLDYIAYQEKTGLPIDFHIYLWEFYDLFDLLDCATDEWELKKEKKSAPQL